MLTKMAEVEHGEPVWPQSGGRACLPYGPLRRLSRRTACMRGPHDGGPS